MFHDFHWYLASYHQQNHHYHPYCLSSFLQYVFSYFHHFYAILGLGITWVWLESHVGHRVMWEIIENHGVCYSNDIYGTPRFDFYTWLYRFLILMKFGEIYCTCVMGLVYEWSLWCLIIVIACIVSQFDRIEFVCHLCWDYELDFLELIWMHVLWVYFYRVLWVKSE